ncbi:MAG: hypothetical protein RQ722_00425 [Desulfuromonadales bacterium]|nr:hypothetical protein [Desulfuromonadales bacterium]
MARLARVVAPGYPHHITQRGNSRQQTFFQDSDYRLYLSLLRERCKKAQVQIWTYCLVGHHTRRPFSFPPVLVTQYLIEVLIIMSFCNQLWICGLTGACKYLFDG